ncbi:hypothetical protein TPHA_0K00990 [Tetrapisispora phaffii CBS 4417]|uniref:glucan 1,3-beta-glucosidase n=1 Tax=Tetrapisispora phaffii (strain ATCC 24235 / CBS 4417 / NBRC 1672 / NRRL Y-8282 / UCD 70-5) TaxID=1071381 RepID=G8BZA5_TETPH|nr:hypothetical protein TPHA_0K00990 [Tetrapisispora phaffii CBS 4417]CCE65233.1 hypothetical protein TPHA_0K00990 [Tetrapisispora phaffii CBS 4417]
MTANYLSYLLTFFIIWLDSTIAGYVPGIQENGSNLTNATYDLTIESSYFNYDRPDNGLNGQPIRGVNIGGWLVLEPYITPSIFEKFRSNGYNDDGIPTDEYQLCRILGVEKAKDMLQQHWNTFYTENDFKNIADKGFNLVRIPVGYWAFARLPDDPYVTGLQEQYLDKAIGWAKKHNLKVWVDLHGAAGSQNGFDNSGLRDALRFLDNENLEVTKTALNYIMEKYSQDCYADTVIGIELLNEPLGPVIDMNKLKNEFLLPSYQFMREKLKRNQIIVIHDSFQGYHYWDDFMTMKQNYWGIVIDHHHYQVFSPGEISRSMDEKIRAICGWGHSSLTEKHWTIMGEFSAALTDCTKWLNGVGRGARYDGTFPSNSASFGTCNNNEDVHNWSQERKDNTRKYIEAQLDSFEMKNGWIFWCYKTENSIEWDAEKLIQYGLFPQPLTDRKYQNQCRN